MAIRVTQAARILGVSRSTIHRWCEEGILPFEMSAAGQRIFKEEELREFYNKRRGIEPKPKPIVFYVRSSNGNDVLIESQIEKLEEKYGKAEKIFKDKASGLNENRKGLTSLLTYIKDNPSDVYVTNKDRLTRFGYSYLEEVFNDRSSTITSMDAEEIKEPHDALMEDFMSLIASFSGKFYRLRGWSQRKQLLQNAMDEVAKHE